MYLPSNASTACWRVMPFPISSRMIWFKRSSMLLTMARPLGSEVGEGVILHLSLVASREFWIARKNFFVPFPLDKIFRKEHARDRDDRERTSDHEGARTIAPNDLMMTSA